MIVPMRYLMILLCASLVAFQDQGQDPESRRPRPPQGAASRPLRPVQEPMRTAVERRDLLQKFKGPSPLEGFYRLVSVHGPRGKAKGRYVGYLAIGRSHMSLQIRGPGETPRIPAIQASFRRYRLRGDRIYMNNLLGHRNLPDGNVELERTGHKDVRRYQLLGTTLRIYQSDTRYMEFLRVE